MTGSLPVLITAITHKGLVRPHNEDTVCVGEWVCSSSMDLPYQVACSLERPLICIVADGMGGHAAGEVASQLVARHLAEQAPKCRDDQELRSLILDANARVYEAARNSPEWQGMGSTVVGIALKNSGHIQFNVGDSRVYRIKGGFLRQLSIDDVRVAQTDPNQTAGQARFSGVITQCLGGTSSLAQIEPHVANEPLVGGWRYLLCSDGLTDMVPLEKIESCIGEDDAKAVVALLEAALSGGGHDNISIIIARIGGRDGEQG